MTEYETAWFIRYKAEIRERLLSMVKAGERGPLNGSFLWNCLEVLAAEESQPA